MKFPCSPERGGGMRYDELFIRRTAGTRIFVSYLIYIAAACFSAWNFRTDRSNSISRGFSAPKLHYYRVVTGTGSAGRPGWRDAGRDNRTNRRYEIRGTRDGHAGSVCGVTRRARRYYY